MEMGEEGSELIGLGWAELMWVSVQRYFDEG